MIDVNRIQDVASKIKNFKERYSTDVGTVNTYQKQKIEVEEKIEKLNIEKEETENKIVVLQEASIEARDNAKDLLKDVDSNAVQMILGDNLSVDIILDKKNNVATAEVVTRAEYPMETIETNPAEEEGGGMADVVALASFWSIAELAGKENIAPRFLDEPTKYVHGNSDKVANFVKEMVEYTERQTFLITADDYVSNIGDIGYKFSLDENGTTQNQRLQ